MRPILFVLRASLLGLAAGAAAQTPQTPPELLESVSSVQVKAPAKTLRIRDEQARQINGAYGLSNGWYLKVHSAAPYIVATIDHDTSLRLYAVAPYRFVSGDNQVEMEFNRGPEGEDMLMSYVPDSSLVRVSVGSAVPLARR